MVASHLGITRDEIIGVGDGFTAQMLTWRALQSSLKAHRRKSPRC